MALSDPIPVRFTDAADAGLTQISAATGMSKAELIRIATDEFLQRTRETGVIVQRHYVNETHGDNSPIIQDLSTSAPPVPSRERTRYQKKGRRNPRKKP